MAGIQFRDLPENFRNQLIPAGREGGTGKEKFIPFTEGGAQGAAYNPSKEEKEELRLRELLARRGGSATLPQGLAQMAVEERLKALQAAVGGMGTVSPQLQRETRPFGGVMRVGF